MAQLLLSRLLDGGVGVPLSRVKELYQQVSIDSYTFIKTNEGQIIA